MTIATERRFRIAVLGGGISGLAAAYTVARARQSGTPVEELLIEARDRLGGSIRTEHVDGFVVEGGPDSFLTEKPEAADLCGELGLAGSLMGSSDRSRRTYIVHHGRLVALPDGLMLVVPTRLGPVLATPLLPLASKLAVVAEYLGLRSRHKPTSEQDESVASFVSRHFGAGMLETIADPLLAGVFGGESSQLSVRAALPRFWQMEQEYGSLTRGVRELKRRRDRLAPNADVASEINNAAGPVFTTLREGLERMVQEMARHFEPSRVRLGERVTALERVSGSDSSRATNGAAARTQYRIRCAGGAEYEADSVILALPTYECSRVLLPFDSDLGKLLGSIPYTPALTVALGYEDGVRETLPPGFGFLVPRKESLRMLACTFVHGKFEHRVPPGRALVRCFLGGARDSGVLDLGDTEIVSLARRELEATLHLSAEPLFHRVYRWPSSMPQYLVGHQERVKAIERSLETLTGVFLAGNAYSGIGISDCIRTGRAAAERAMQNVKTGYALPR